MDEHTYQIKELRKELNQETDTIKKYLFGIVFFLWIIFGLIIKLSEKIYFEVYQEYTTFLDWLWWGSIALLIFYFIKDQNKKLAEDLREQNVSKFKKYWNYFTENLTIVLGFALIGGLIWFFKNYF